MTVQFNEIGEISITSDSRWSQRLIISTQSTLESQLQINKLRHLPFEIELDSCVTSVCEQLFQIFFEENLAGTQLGLSKVGGEAGDVPGSLYVQSRRIRDGMPRP